MSLCLCTSALDFYVCDLLHCVSGVCGHMNHLLCPKQASVQAQRQHHSVSVVATSSHVLVELHLPNPKRIRITGEALHVWDVQVQLEQHCAKKEHESFYLPLSKLTSP